MKERISKIENNPQDKNSVAWKKLCDYVDKVALEDREEFSPLEELGKDLFAQIHTLPETISKLKKVKKVWLYGSKLKRIPPEIGKMEALEYLDIYTSYDLHWFPYEITNCKNLKDSRVSTRVLYGNWKNRMGFPRLNHNPVRYSDNKINCSICGNVMTYEQTNQFWISLKVGTDVLPLLTNLCSDECKNELPKPPKYHLQFAHKGGSDLEQPFDENEIFQLEIKKYEEEQNKNLNTTNHTDDNKINPNESIRLIEKSKFPMLKLIRKIWDR